MRRSLEAERPPSVDDQGSARSRKIDCIQNLFEQRANEAPAAVALRVDGDLMTYAELNSRANGVANQLVALGASVGEPVGIHVDRSFELVVAILGTLKAGCSFLPLDPTYPTERLRFISSDAKAKIVLSQAAESDRGGLPDCHIASLASIPGASGIDVEDDRIDRTSADDAASIFYTSGSTGTPKGVVLPHRAHFSRLPSRQIASEIGAADRFLLKSPVGFSSIIREIFWPLSVGGSVAITPPEVHRDPSQLALLIEHHEVTIAILVPSQLATLLERPGFRERARTLRHVILGGEAVPSGLPDLFFANCEARLHQIYGATEATTATHFRFYRHQSNQARCIGRAANCTVYLLDDQMRPVEHGGLGEIFVGGPGVALGYQNAPELTDKKFLDDPFDPASRYKLYRTGDLGRLRADGNLEFVGRADHQVQVRGCRVELGEIKDALSEFPEAQRVEVVAREDAGLGARIIAYMIPEAGTTPEVDRIREFLAERIPEYMLPSAYAFLGSFPVTHLGKVDINALPEPGRERPRLATPYSAPCSTIERELVELWQRLLQIEQIGTLDGFFDLGGDSFLAVQLANHVGTEFGYELFLADFFENPTIRSTAQLIQEAVSTR